MPAFLPTLRATAHKTSPATSATERKVILGDYYQALAAAGVDIAGRSRAWPVERAVAEGYERVVWVFNCVEWIAGNSSRLPFRLRDRSGVVDDHPLYRVLNKRANPLETGQQFRKRLSAQILLSKRGAFVEVQTSRGGDVIRADLLPPARTRVVPGTGNDLVKCYALYPRGGGAPRLIDPERVRWFREPHPLDPYSGVTPLEAIGMSIELDYFARLYNVSFMRRDGRPGTVIGVNGDMDEDDMERIEAKFGSGPLDAGSLSVIAGDLSVIDLAARPRDMQYGQTSSNAKTEILAGFRLGESLFNAAGRTFDNAEQEHYNAWTGPMAVHNSLVAGGWDDDSLDDLDGYLDTTSVEVLQLPLQKAREEARTEVEQGLRSIESYARLAGYADQIESSPASRALWLPSGRTPIAARKADEEAVKALAEAAKPPAPMIGHPGVPPALPPGGDGGGGGGGGGDGGGDTGGGGGGTPLPAAPTPPALTATPQPPALTATGSPTTEGKVAVSTTRFRFRVVDGEAKAAQSPPGGGDPPHPRMRVVPLVKAADQGWRETDPGSDVRDRLEQTIANTLAALVDRWVARTISRAQSPKSRKHTRHWTPQYATDTRVGTKAVDASRVVDEQQWSADAEAANEPTVNAAAVAAAAALYLAMSADDGEPDPDFLAAIVADTVAGILALIGASALRQAALLADMINNLDQSGADMDAIVTATRSHARSMNEWAAGLAVQAATGAVEGAREAAVEDLTSRPDSDLDVEQTWRTRRDEKVRPSHVAADGQTVPAGQPFEVGGALLRFPGDPRAPWREVANCRCHRQWRHRHTGRYVANPGTSTKAMQTKADVTGVGEQFAATAQHAGSVVLHIGGRTYVWQPHQHPRDSHGKFISTGGEVRTATAGLAKVTGVVDANHVEVQNAAGQTSVVNRRDVTVVKAPGGGAPTGKVADVATDVGPATEGGSGREIVQHRDGWTGTVTNPGRVMTTVERHDTGETANVPVDATYHLGTEAPPQAQAPAASATPETPDAATAMILGGYQPGDRVTISHSGHPDDGQTVTVERATGATGGAGGGGAVIARREDGSEARLSRYAMAVPAAVVNVPDSALTDAQTRALADPRSDGHRFIRSRRVPSGGYAYDLYEFRNGQQRLVQRGRTREESQSWLGTPKEERARVIAAAPVDTSAEREAGIHSGVGDYPDGGAANGPVRGDSRTDVAGGRTGAVQGAAEPDQVLRRPGNASPGPDRRDDVLAGGAARGDVRAAADAAAAGAVDGGADRDTGGAGAPDATGPAADLGRRTAVDTGADTGGPGVDLGADGVPGRPDGVPADDAGAVRDVGADQPLPNPDAMPTATGGVDFRPGGMDDLAPAGKVAKLNANMAALRTLRALQAEDRPATPEEQAVLARWAGWGGLPDVFDDRKPQFAVQRAELYRLMSESEINEARRNTLNAHYTDAHVVENVWKAVGDLGFDGGRVLEPGSGSGTFIGYAPDNAAMVGVELDSTTAAISAYLYPNATIRNESFADTNVPDGSFDATIGNVPFGNRPLTDRRHNPTGESIHNHFILKSMALTRPGGIVAVLTSRYTMDTQSSRARQMMADRADLIGAVRLPTGSHQRAAETAVIEDILIFRVREPGAAPQADQSWVQAHKQDINGFDLTVNDYWAEHADHVLGDLSAEKGQYGTGDMIVRGDRSMPDLPNVLARIVDDAKTNGLTATASAEALPDLIDADTSRHEGHIRAEDDGTFTQATGGAAVPFTPPNAQAPELRALIGLRDGLNDLLNAEAATADDTPQIAALRQELNDRYDAYVAKFGPVNRFGITKSGARKPPGQGQFRRDPQSAIVRALETYDPETQTATKSDVFTKRAVAPREIRTTADNPQDALALSMEMHGRVDLPTIATLLGTDEATARADLGTLVYEQPPLTPEEQAAAEQVLAAQNVGDLDAASAVDLSSVGDSVRAAGDLEPSSAYLSGHVRRKLAAAKAAAAVDQRFQVNVDALQAVIPPDLGPEEIDGRLGAAWIDEGTIQQFVSGLMNENRYARSRVQVSHSGGSIWTVVAPRQGNLATEQWGTPDRPVGELVQALLEQRPIKVTRTVEDADGNKRSIPDFEATLAAQAKAEELQERFSEWLWEDPDRARRLQATYNDRFNGIVLRQYTATEGRQFPGMSPQFSPHEHVKAAAERIVQEPTVLLAHVVGAGKTAEMVIGTQELRRLGLARKPAIVVPNHMLEQMGREYLEIYPQAKILAAGTEDLQGEKRSEFVARAATGDWDAVILTQSAFEAIPMSREQQQAYIDREMAVMREQLAQAASSDRSDQAGKRTVKKMENALLRAEEALKKKLDKTKDRGVTFEQTGIDYLMVDEAHMYSNLRTLSNIQSAGTPGSDRATDLHMKIEYLRENNDSGRVATFATGTPIRNTVTQAYVMQRFLRPDLLTAAGIHSFDQWAGTFGQVVEETELKPEGRGFRQTSRFAKFRNVPELLRMFHTFADVKLAEDLNLKTPNLIGGRTETVVVPSTAALRDYVTDLGDRAEAVRAGNVDPTEDNMLKISGDGRKAALSMALVGQDHEPGKIETAADRISTIYETNKDRVYGDDPTPGALQIVFLDMGTPKDKNKTPSEDSESATNDYLDGSDSSFNAYDRLKVELVDRGVPADKIRYIHEAKNDAQKAEMFAAARSGRISVLIGSSEKMGVGTNIQRRAVAQHHLDAPWRPADVEQRDGRIMRHGNLNPDVEIVRYVTEGSFDAYMWQTLERKAKFINQIMRGSLDVREIEDVGDTALNAAEVKALATGNPDLLEKSKADTLLAKLERLERAYNRSQVNMRSEISRYEGLIPEWTSAADALDAAIAKRVDTRGDAFSATVNGETFTKRGEAAAAFVAAMGRVLDNDFWSGTERVVGQIGGFDVTAHTEHDRRDGGRVLSIQFMGVPGEVVGLRRPDLQTTSVYDRETGDYTEQPPTALTGIVSRLENGLEAFDAQRARLLDSISTGQEEIDRMQGRSGGVFPRAAELAEVRAKATRLAAKMDRDARRADGQDIPFDPAIDGDLPDDGLPDAGPPPPDMEPSAAPPGPPTIAESNPAPRPSIGLLRARTPEPGAAYMIDATNGDRLTVDSTNGSVIDVAPDWSNLADMQASGVLEPSPYNGYTYMVTDPAFRAATGSPRPVPADGRGRVDNTPDYVIAGLGLSTADPGSATYARDTSADVPAAVELWRAQLPDTPQPVWLAFDNGQYIGHGADRAGVLQEVDATRSMLAAPAPAVPTPAAAPSEVRLDRTAPGAYTATTDDGRTYAVVRASHGGALSSMNSGAWHVMEGSATGPRLGQFGSLQEATSAIGDGSVAAPAPAASADDTLTRARGLVLAAAARNGGAFPLHIEGAGQSGSWADDVRVYSYDPATGRVDGEATNNDGTSYPFEANLSEITSVGTSTAKVPTDYAPAAYRDANGALWTAQRDANGTLRLVDDSGRPSTFASVSSLHGPLTPAAAPVPDRPVERQPNTATFDAAQRDANVAVAAAGRLKPAQRIDGATAAPGLAVAAADPSPRRAITAAMIAAARDGQPRYVEAGANGWGSSDTLVNRHNGHYRVEPNGDVWDVEPGPGADPTAPTVERRMSDAAVAHALDENLSPARPSGAPSGLDAQGFADTTGAAATPEITAQIATVQADVTAAQTRLDSLQQALDENVAVLPAGTVRDQVVTALQTGIDAQRAVRDAAQAELDRLQGAGTKSLWRRIEVKSAGSEIRVRVGSTSYIWKPAEHPRDHHGKFISQGGEVRTAAGDLAQVTDIVDANHVEVQKSDGGKEVLDRHDVTVTKAPDGGAPHADVSKVGTDAAPAGHAATDRTIVQHQDGWTGTVTGGTGADLHVQRHDTGTTETAHATSLFHVGHEFSDTPMAPPSATAATHDARPVTPPTGDMTALDDRSLIAGLNGAPTPDVQSQLDAELTSRAEKQATALLARVAPVEASTTALLHGVADEQGIRMRGLGEHGDGDFRLKTHASLSRKIKTLSIEKVKPTDRVANDINDALRYTMEADAANYAASTQTVLDRLVSEGYTVNAGNSWVDGNSYKGINCTVTAPDGSMFELQFHTPESFVLKDGELHKHYEAMRDASLPAAERLAAWQQCVQLSAALPVPPGVESVGDQKSYPAPVALPDGGPDATPAVTVGPDGDSGPAVPVPDDVHAALSQIKVEGSPEGTGTADDPIAVGDDLPRAAQLLAQGKHIRLDQPEQVASLMDALGAEADRLAKTGQRGNFDLCRVSVPGTNLFCAQNTGRTRVQMPQLSGRTVPGTPAAAVADARGKANLSQSFRDELGRLGIGVTDQTMPASHLRASQSELDGETVSGLVTALRGGTLRETRIFVTRDGYVIDGHHRWAAYVAVDAQDNHLGDVDMPVAVLDMDIGAALDFANEFSHRMGMAPKASGEGMGRPPHAPEPGSPAPLVSTEMGDAEYAAHSARVVQTLNELVAAGQTTDALYTVDPERTKWTPERAQKHKEIVDSLYARAASVPSDGKAIIAGGLPGAGKSTVLGGHAGLDSSQYLTVNPDDVKEEMARRGMVPEVEGMSPNEVATLYHEESGHIANLLARTAYADRKNVIWDISMSSVGSVKRRMTEMRDAGYTDVSSVFVDLPIETSVSRAVHRHRQGMEQYRAGVGLGGRWMPPEIIRASSSPVASSKNRETFDTLRGEFDHWSIYDTSTGTPRLVATDTDPAAATAGGAAAPDAAVQADYARRGLDEHGFAKVYEDAPLDWGNRLAQAATSDADRALARSGDTAAIRARLVELGVTINPARTA